jgi:pimeloyl-ACP methyl ester carboxylesterase
VAPGPRLGDALAARCRTIRPELPAPGTAALAAPGAAAAAGAADPPHAFADWLRDFLDGLGVEAAAVVAAPGYGLAALAFAGSDAERVARVLLLDAGGAGGGAARAAAGVPVLALGAGADGAALAAALAFLAGAAAPSAPPA